MSVNAKSVIFDIAESHNPGIDPPAIRSIDFLLAGVSLGLVQADYTAYATTTSDLVVSPEFAFDTSLSLIGSSTNTSWVATMTTGQRLIVVFNAAQDFDSIVINNYHNSGLDTLYGASSVVVNISSDDIIDTTYNATITNGILLDTKSVWDAHVASDIADDQTVFPKPSTLTVSGDIGLSGSVALFQPTIITLTGGIGLFGYVALNNPINISGRVGLLGSMQIATPKNTLSGLIGLSGNISAINNIPIGMMGKVALSGEVETIRINKDVSIVGEVFFTGTVFTKTGIPDCSLPSFDSSRWT